MGLILDAKELDISLIVSMHTQLASIEHCQVLREPAIPLRLGYALLMQELNEGDNYVVAWPAGCPQKGEG